MSVFLYNTSLFLYRIGIRLAYPFNPKAKKWVDGRKDIFSQMKTDLTDCRQSVAWFHCASLGEYEQAKPLIASYSSNYPTHRIVLTFFSPSGYQSYQPNPNIDHIYYLPIDNHKNAVTFLDILQPSVVFFIKYEFWYHFLHQLHRRNIDTYLVSATFRKKQLFFKPYGTFYRKMLMLFQHIFLQNAQSKKLLDQYNIHHTSVIGDTRIDQVIQNKKDSDCTSNPLLPSLLTERKVMVCGSTWPADEQLLKRWHQKNLDWFLIIAPHEVDQTHIIDIQERYAYAEPLLYSRLSDSLIKDKTTNVLIVDSIGQLKFLYKWADAAYIGGGFGLGIHNTLEAAVFKIPVFFGPNYKKFTEAHELISRKIGFAIQNEQELNKQIHPTQTSTQKARIQEQCSAYFEQSKGASKRILKHLSASN